MDWEACIICGTSIGELKCPANSLQGNGLSIYEVFLANVNGFKKINLLPASVNFEEDKLRNAYMTTMLSGTSHVT